jgi:hypothetical protein
VTHRLRWPRAKREYLASFSAGQLDEYLTAIEEFWSAHYGQPITATEGAEGHCEGMAAIAFSERLRLARRSAAAEGLRR